MEIEMKRQKIDCNIVGVDRMIPAFIDLIEIPYSERLVFWNAVITLTDDDYKQLINGRSSLENVVVHLSDGRKGGFHIEYGVAASNGYREIAGVGKPS
jgi:hypothetical protein